MKQPNVMGGGPHASETYEEQVARLGAERDRKFEAEREAEESERMRANLAANPPKPNKRLVEYELPEGVRVGKPFKDPKSGEETAISERSVLNAGMPVYGMAEAYSKLAEATRDGDAGKYDGGDFLKYHFRIAKATSELLAIPNRATSLTTTIELDSGYHLPVTFRYVGEEPRQIKLVDALVRMGIGNPDAHELLAYLHTGRKDAKFGERRARDIMDVVDAYRAEMPAYEKVKGRLREMIPASITGLDGRIFSDIDENIRKIEEELRITLKAIVEELDKPMMRLARRPDAKKYLGRGWVARGDA